MKLFFVILNGAVPCHPERIVLVILNGAAGGVKDLESSPVSCVRFFAGAQNDRRTLGMTGG